MKKPWEGSFDPFRIFGNLYFVGTPPASVHLVDTGEGLIMLDTEKKATLVRSGDQRAFIDPGEWHPYNLWCIENLEKMINKEKA